MTGTDVHIPTLETERLILRAYRLSDFETYASTLASARMVHVDRLDRHDAWFVFCNELAGWHLRGAGLFAVDRHDGTFVGTVGIQQPDHFPEPELGWTLHDGHEGRGYATEAARAVLAWARDLARDRVASLVSYVAPANAASIAVARRLGATLDRAAPRPAGAAADDTHVYRHWGAA